VEIKRDRQRGIVKEIQARKGEKEDIEKLFDDLSTEVYIIFRL
jgi:hypothetical protein